MGNDWDAHTGACLQTLEGHDWEVTSVVFSPDSNCVASGSFDKTMKIWDLFYLHSYAGCQLPSCAHLHHLKGVQWTWHWHCTPNGRYPSPSVTPS